MVTASAQIASVDVRQIFICQHGTRRSIEHKVQTLPRDVRREAADHPQQIVCAAEVGMRVGGDEARRVVPHHAVRQIELLESGQPRETVGVDLEQRAALHEKIDQSEIGLQETVPLGMRDDRHEIHRKDRVHIAHQPPRAHIVEIKLDEQVAAVVDRHLFEPLGRIDRVVHIDLRARVQPQRKLALFDLLPHAQDALVAAAHIGVDLLGLRQMRRGDDAVDAVLHARFAQAHGFVQRVRAVVDVI
jgi:hypothetical protein